MPEIRTEARGRNKAGIRVAGLWFALVFLMLAGLVMHWYYQQQLQSLQEQLVATQESFAGLGEESLQQLLQLDERTAGLAALQGRVQGLAVQLAGLRDELGGLDTASSNIKALQGGQAELQRQLPRLGRQLDEQSQAVEQAALALDAAQQKLQERQLKQEKELAEQDEALSALALELTSSLLEWQTRWQAEQEQLDTLTSGLALMRSSLEPLEQLDERHGQLQESVLKLAQQVEADRKRQRQLEEEITAFRLQVTRATDRLQQRLDAQ